MAAQTKKASVPPPLPHAEISTRPARVRWSLGELPAKDGHRVSIGFTCSIAVVDEPAERKLLAEVFPHSASLTAAAVIAHFLPALRSAAEHRAAADPAESLLQPEAKPGWIETLRAAANEVGFSCGLEVLAPLDIELTSPTLQRERVEQMQRIAAERRSADRVGQFARAADLLKQWDTLKSTVPSVTPGKLLEQINPADRGLMLDTLLIASAGNNSNQATTDLWAVSGQSLVRIDIKSDSPQPKIISLPTTAGPLRSISLSEGKLLIGARSGILVADPASPESAPVYCCPSLVSEHGFTSVTQIGQHLWACHRVAGLVGWKPGQLQQPAVVFSPAQLGGEPRQLMASGLFAVGSQLHRISPALKIEPVLQTQPIIAILATDSAILVAGEAGLVMQLDKSTLEKTNDIQTTGRLSGAALLPWLSSSRLLLNRADGAIDCIGLEDQLLTQFTSGQTAMRAVTASPAKVAAMTSDRQRILLWNPWDGRKPAAEIYLMGITHHRIADLAL